MFGSHYPGNKDLDYELTDAPHISEMMWGTNHLHQMASFGKFATMVLVEMNPAEAKMRPRFRWRSQ